MLGDWDGTSALPVSPDFVQQFAEVLITRLLPLRQEDLQKWEQDPEEWMNEEEQDRWEYDLRVSRAFFPRIPETMKISLTRICTQPCAEYVLKALLSAHREQLGPNMAALLQQVSSRSPIINSTGLDDELTVLLHPQRRRVWTTCS